MNEHELFSPVELQDHLQRLEDRNPNANCRVRVGTALRRALTIVWLHAQRDAVLALHADYWGKCEHDGQAWPCPTARAAGCGF